MRVILTSGVLSRGECCLLFGVDASLLPSSVIITGSIGDIGCPLVVVGVEGAVEYTDDGDGVEYGVETAVVLLMTAQVVTVGGLAHLLLSALACFATLGSERLLQRLRRICDRNDNGLIYIVVHCGVLAIFIVSATLRRNISQDCLKLTAQTSK